VPRLSPKSPPMLRALCRVRRVVQRRQRKIRVWLTGRPEREGKRKPERRDRRRREGDRDRDRRPCMQGCLLWVSIALMPPVLVLCLLLHPLPLALLDLATMVNDDSYSIRIHPSGEGQALAQRGWGFACIIGWALCIIVSRTEERRLLTHGRR